MVALRKQSPRPPARMTVDEFLVWDIEDMTGRRWQLVDGEPVLMAPAAERHGIIQGEIAALLVDHLRRTGQPCRVVIAPGIVPRVRANQNFRVPDLGVTCSAPSDTVMTVAPVLLVEILSPGNESRTRANVWTYTTLPSVQEILLVRSTRMEIELLRRGSDGNWPEEALVLRPPETLVLTSLDMTMPVSDLYRSAGLTA